MLQIKTPRKFFEALIRGSAFGERTIGPQDLQNDSKKWMRIQVWSSRDLRIRLANGIRILQAQFFGNVHACYRKDFCRTYPFQLNEHFVPVGFLKKIGND